MKCHPRLVWMHLQQCYRFLPSERQHLGRLHPAMRFRILISQPPWIYTLPSRARSSSIVVSPMRPGDPDGFGYCGSNVPRLGLATPSSTAASEPECENRALSPGPLAGIIVGAFAVVVITPLHPLLSQETARHASRFRSCCYRAM